MPSGIPRGSAKTADHAMKNLASTLGDYLEAEAEKGHMIPEQTLRKRLFMAIRNADILPRRRAISEDDNFMGLVDAQSFSKTEGMFEPWVTNKATSAKPTTEPALEQSA